MRLLLPLLLTGALTAGEAAAAERGEKGPCRHPVGVAPARVPVPEGAPLPGGLLACVTCHERADGGPVRWGAGRPPFEACFACHEPGRFARFDPHEADPGTAGGEHICLHCHVGPPERGTDGVHLRAGLRETCRGCHRPAPHVGATEHAGVLPADFVARKTAAEQAAGIVLPLDETGAMGCATCHNPHGGGAIPKDDPAGRRAPPEDPVTRPALFEAVVSAGVRARLASADAAPAVRLRNRSGRLLRLPLRESQLCRACHGTPAARSRKDRE